MHGLRPLLSQGPPTGPAAVLSAVSLQCRATLDPVLELLQLLMPILQQARQLCVSSLPPPQRAACPGMLPEQHFAAPDCCIPLSALSGSATCSRLCFMCSKLSDSIGRLQADPELHDHIQTAEMPPYFALGWFITWFSHNVQQLDQISRLFDLFMASHPLMPLYVVVQVMMVSVELFLLIACMSARAT